jgi:glycosyltransferase involved in cell wall biosynthesis
MNSQSMPVTAIIPTRNEERNLPACLAALVGFTDVIVVDSGSTDGTQEIARRAGAKLVQFEWKGGFPKKRNWMLLNYSFRTRWVLFVDADERITCEFRNRLARISAVSPGLAVAQHSEKDERCLMVLQPVKSPDSHAN